MMVSHTNFWIAKRRSVFGRSRDGLFDHPKHVGMLVDTTDSMDTIGKISETITARIYEPNDVQYSILSSFRVRFSKIGGGAILHGRGLATGSCAICLKTEKPQALQKTKSAIVGIRLGDEFSENHGIVMTFARLFGGCMDVRIPKIQMATIS